MNSPYLKGIINLFSFPPRHFIPTLNSYLHAFFKTKQASLPMEIQIEPSAVCNLHCRMCSLNKSHQPLKFLTPESLSLIIKKLKPISINLTGMGETLLNPYFGQLLRLCSQNKISTTFITNLQLLNKKHLYYLKKYPVKYIKISMESGIPKKYSQIRAGADYSLLVKNLKLLKQFVVKNSLPTQIIINVVLLDFNLKDIRHLTKIFDLADSLNIDTVSTQNIHQISPYINHLYESGKIKTIFQNLESYAQNHHLKVTFPSTVIKNKQCYYPWIYPQITASGDILPCCIIPQFIDYDTALSRFSFGNIVRQDSNSVWNGDSAKKFRQNHQHYSFCRNCSKNKGIL